MGKKNGNSFGSFNSFSKSKSTEPKGIAPIRTEFSRGSVPDSIYTSNRESAWSRWRRGFEIYSNSSIGDVYSYPFDYIVPVGSSPLTGNEPKIPGVFQGFPTKNKELGMHWAGVRLAGSLRLDNIEDRFGTKASIASVTEDDDFWYVQLAGSWGAFPFTLPAPLFVYTGPTRPPLYPMNGEIFETRIVEEGGAPITSETIDPTTQKRYGYIQAVVVETREETGVIKLQKQGSVESTPDAVFITPARTAPQVGRFMMTGTRYCCSCQDFTRRDYAYISQLGSTSNQKIFPRTKASVIKPGRFERMYKGEVVTGVGPIPSVRPKLDEQGRKIPDDRAMSKGNEDRAMEVIAPSAEYEIPPQVTPTSETEQGATRDRPGMFRDFGGVYKRSTPLPSLEGATSEGMPTFNDYDSTRNPDGSYNIVSLTDFWTPLLDEIRYCKHIYAMKFAEKVFPPEPSDFPVGTAEGLVEWEQKLVEKTNKDNEKANYEIARKGLAQMDVPPYNCGAPMMMPMAQKLFNIPSDFVQMSSFRMYDKNGKEYIPYEGGRPGT